MSRSFICIFLQMDYIDDIVHYSVHLYIRVTIHAIFTWTRRICPPHMSSRCITSERQQLYFKIRVRLQLIHVLKECMFILSCFFFFNSNVTCFGQMRPPEDAAEILTRACLGKRQVWSP